MNQEAIVGCLLGTAVGDALGLPYEGVSPQRAKRMLGPPDRYRFVFGRGMISDDTEHTCMVAQCLMESNGDVDRFTRLFAKRLRWWILALPAGVGKATARAGIKLWLGAKPERAGVFSAGNGPAMRSAILGAAIDDRERMLRFVRASARLTHTDPKAEFGAIAVALAARHARLTREVDASVWIAETEEAIGASGAEFIELLKQAIASVDDDQPTESFAKTLGLTGGVSGYTYHTVPVAIHAWLSHSGQYSDAIESIIRCGGDADTTAAIVGGILGTQVGRGGIPERLLTGICEWPRSVRWMEELGRQLADTIDSSQQTTTPIRAPRAGAVAVILRNLLFLAIVLFHGFRRLAPPYA